MPKNSFYMYVVICIINIIIKLIIRIFINRDVKFIYNINSIMKNKHMSILITNLLSIQNDHIFHYFPNFFTQNKVASQGI